MLDPAAMDCAIQERPRLLFVDDEQRILVSLKSIFRSDYEVRTTTNGAEALQILREWEADVIISDQRMPEMTGVEVLKAAADIRPGTTRVLLTGYSDLEAIIGSVNDSEVFRFVSKPWRRDDLSKTMQAAVEQARQPVAYALATPPDVAVESDAETQAPSVLPHAAVPPSNTPLPLAATGAAPDTASSDAMGVLVLDSHPAERQALMHTLRNGWPTYTAADIEEALTLIQAHRIGVVLTEAVFEGQPVTALVSALRQARPHLVIIILTHQPDAHHIIDLINYGQVYRVLRKPLKASVLRGAVTLAGHRHGYLANNPAQAQRLASGLAELPAEQRQSGLFTKIRQMFRFA